MRLFFAYWPSADKAEEIMPWVRQAHALYGGRMMRKDTLHMTLAFLGPVDESAAQELAQACSAWTLPTGSMLLREPGRFRNAKVVWVGPSAAEPASLDWLYQAHQQLWNRLEPFGWQAPESTFRPHVSLLRNAGAGELGALQRPAVSWTPERCVLVASRPTDTGSHYTVLAELGLTL